MTLAPGTRLGPYEVLAPLGVGGMGEVYRGRDTRLGRDVAVKVLPEAFATDPDRLARFQREAKMLASLNHPNIGGIHGLEDANGVTALVMELVEGEDLSQRIARGAIPLDEALPIARQIAEALEAAHEQGIIHRDLKPANVKVRDDGTVKVLDFGLAKPLAPPGVSPSASLTPTITTPAMTQLGVILGTAAYMAPEQAKGKPADKRSDLWAFGCVLYEMLTGARAFAGDDVSDTLAAVLRGEPDWRTLPSETPASIRRLLRRCLEKDRKRRLADAAGARLEIDDALMSPALDGQSGATAAPPVPRWRKAMPAAAAIIVGLAAGYGAWTLKPAAPRVVTRFAVSLGADERFNFPWRLLALSPDGKYLAYVANSRVNLRPLDRLESAPVRGTESSAGRGSPGTRNPGTRSPSFSPDGRWIGFWQDGQIKKVGINGGAAVSIAPAGNASGITWEDDGTILFSEGSNILRVSESGGTPEVIVAETTGLVQSPHRLPGTRTILFTLFPAGTASTEPEIVVRSLDTGQQQTVIRGGVDADYLPTGHLAYYAAGTLLAVPFDLRALKVSGAPVPVAENVANSSFPGRVVLAHLATSRSGTLAYMTGGARTLADTGSRTLVWVDRSGREEPLGAPEGPYVYPRLSPEGRRVALTVRDQQREIWILDVGRKMLARLTSDPAEDRHNSWTPDGKRIAFASARGGDSAIWWQAADGTGVPERLAGFPFSQVSNFLPSAVSPDGSSLVATVNPGPGGSGLADLWIVPLTGDHQPTPLLQSSFAERNGEVSPDGRWIAYESLETGRAEIYVRPFPDVTAGKLAVSTTGGSQPLWARSGRELFFVAPSGALMSVRVDGGLPLTIGPPAKVLEGSFVWSLPTYAGRQYDISADGRRFLVMKQTHDQTDLPASVTVVQNWFEELKRLVPTK